MAKYVSFVVNVKQIKEDSYYCNQLFFLVLNVKESFKLIDIYIHHKKNQVYYYFYCKNGVTTDLIYEIKKEIKSFIKEYTYISYKISPD